MEVILKFLSLIVIGALIGGITNYFAVKMLFRPLHPVYIGKWKLPFTPGLIPKRHHEIAEKLGEVVVEHLLTPEGLTEKLHEEKFVAEVNEVVTKEVLKLLESDETLFNLLQSWNVEDADEKTEEFLLKKLEEKYWHVIENMKNKKIAEILPIEFQQFIDRNIFTVADVLCEKAASYFESEDGKRSIGNFIERFLGDKLPIGNMVKMFFGNDMVMGKVQHEIVKFLYQPSTTELLDKIIRNEWTNFRDKTFAELEENINEEKILQWLKNAVRQQVQVKDWFYKPIGELLHDHKDLILDELVPSFVMKARDFIASKVGTVLEKLQLEEVVQRQVESFPLERLEEIVLTISSREFKMITYLGALLGGMIGFIQGILFFVV